MRVLVLSAFVLLLGFGVVLSTGACGGGGGSTTTQPPDASLFTGPYFMSLMFLNDGAPDRARAFWGSASADGAGAWTSILGENENGTVTAPAAGPPSGYTVGADRTWVWQLGGMDAARGGITADGRVVTAATIVSGSDPALLFMVRREGSWSAASLNGVYHMCALRYDAPGTSLLSWWGTVTFDGAGAAVASFSQNDEGVITGPLGGPTNYTVMADGTTTIDAPPGSTYQGGILLGGDLVIVSGAIVAPNLPGILILIRQSTGASLATASGTYFLCGLSRDGGGGFESITGPAAVDGAGNISVTFTRNDDGVITNDPPQAATYSVAANGALTVNTGGGEVYLGAITPDGRFAMISGETTGASNPQINFLLR